VLSPEPTWTPIPPAEGAVDSALIAPDSRQTVAVPAGCRTAGIEPPSLTTNDEVVITWSWSASRYALLQDHIERARYEVDLDQRPLLDWRDYIRQPMRRGQFGRSPGATLPGSLPRASTSSATACSGPN